MKSKYHGLNQISEKVNMLFFIEVNTIPDLMLNIVGKNISENNYHECGLVVVRRLTYNRLYFNCDVKRTKVCTKRGRDWPAFDLINCSPVFEWLIFAKSFLSTK